MRALTFAYKNEDHVKYVKKSKTDFDFFPDKRSPIASKLYPYSPLYQIRTNVFDSVISCKLNESVAAVTERIARHEVHRLVITDDDNKVIGILSLSDLLKFLIFRPGGGAPSSTTQESAGLTSSSSSSSSSVVYDRRRSSSGEVKTRRRNQSETIPEVSEET